MTSVTLFLDFDGVLHASNAYPSQYFEKLPLLRSTLEKSSRSVQVVISSTWREKHSLSTLKEKLPGLNVVDTTHEPSKNPEFAMYTRHGECLEWMRQNEPYGQWLALDDRFDWFKPFTKELIIVPHQTGLTQQNCEDLLNRLR